MSESYDNYLCVMMGIPHDLLEAERMGAFEEDAIPFDDAIDAVDTSLTA